MVFGIIHNQSRKVEKQSDNIGERKEERSKEKKIKRQKDRKTERV